ncbi:hypothetical protein [Nocardioides donggukensis]|uniref:Uncharacterized protein n=1 Tax=Nocardioides donggukensis TaxID=2774019 RepID=A0A927K6P4_9ACTN|nr:hypothetical protein [Nocardioides donggukensis]MBD8870008.1 hypothetical protein [Nocardioides donggukensis]
MSTPTGGPELTRFLDELRDLPGQLPPPVPSPELRALLDEGLPPQRPGRRGRKASASVAGVVLLGVAGTTWAAAADVLPAPVRELVHRVVGGDPPAEEPPAPGQPAPDGSGDDAGAVPESRGSAPERAVLDERRGRDRPGADAGADRDAPGPPTGTSGPGGDAGEEHPGGKDRDRGTAQGHQGDQDDQDDHEGQDAQDAKDDENDQGRDRGDDRGDGGRSASGKGDRQGAQDQDGSGSKAAPGDQGDDED